MVECEAILNSRSLTLDIISDVNSPAKKLCIPNINFVKFGKGSIRYFGPVIWNSIPAEIRNANTLSSFKK